MKSELEIIKQKYGERMMRLCRKYLPKLLDVPGLVLELLDKNFYRYNKLAEDIEEQKKCYEFMGFMYSKGNIGLDKNISINDKSTAKELMARAGYLLYPECKTEAEIQSFRHYYKRDDGKVITYEPHKRLVQRDGEELCTFNGGRLMSARVWFAVKNDVAKYKREDYKNPQRQDDYSTSVISIQFSKNDYSTLSIKSRYNHSAAGSDNTFNSNLDNIIEGLTNAFERDFGVRDKMAKCGPTLEIDGYILANDGKYYPYNQEIKGVYYCPNNMIINQKLEVIKLPNHQMLVDYFIIDCNQHTIKLYDETLRDSFVKEYSINQKIIAEKNGVLKIIKQNGDTAILKINKRREIISLEDENLKECGDNFMCKNKTLSSLSLAKLEVCGDNFFEKNNSMKEAIFPNLNTCGNNFLSNNIIIDKINFLQLRECGWGFFQNNLLLKEANFPMLEKIGSDFFFKNKVLKNLSLPRLKKCGYSFLFNNEALEDLSLPLLESCADRFMSMNKTLKTFHAPNLKKCGQLFFYFGAQLKKLELPSLEECAQRFMFEQTNLEEFSAPKLQSIGVSFFSWQPKIVKLNVSKEVMKTWKKNGCSPLKIRLAIVKNNLKCSLNNLKNNIKK